MKITIRAVLLSAIVVALLPGCSTPGAVSSTPDERFREGEKLFANKNYEAAIEQWKKVKESFLSPEVTAKAELNIANAYFLNKDYIEAAAAYEDFRKLHPRHEQAGYALYQQAMSYYLQIHGIDTDQTPVESALGLFEAYLKLYPGGEYAADADALRVKCRDKQLEYEIYVGKFYMSTNKYPAALGRFERALKNFEKLPHQAELLLLLGETYLKAEQKPKGRETLERLLADYPNSPHANEARELLKDSHG